MTGSFAKDVADDQAVSRASGAQSSPPVVPKTTTKKTAPVVASTTTDKTTSVPQQTGSAPPIFVLLPPGQLGISFSGRPPVARQVLSTSPVKDQISEGMIVKALILEDGKVLHDMNETELWAALSKSKESEGRAVLVMEPSSSSTTKTKVATTAASGSTTKSKAFSQEPSGSDAKEPAFPPELLVPIPSGRLAPGDDVDLRSLSLEELQSLKRKLKEELKQYDMTFAREHGRMPVKAEKEPIRHLYETYNAVKAQIALLDSEEMECLSIDHDWPMEVPKALSKKVPRAPSEESRSPDLTELEEEKSKLHLLLRSYEKDFYKKHQRQVSSSADIRPVASQYRRYKELKQLLSKERGGEMSWKSDPSFSFGE